MSDGRLFLEARQTAEKALTVLAIIPLRPLAIHWLTPAVYIEGISSRFVDDLVKAMGWREQADCPASSSR
jgi:hypothetical protein